MIIACDSVVNRYCYICGYIHESKEDYRICDYCLQHKRWVYLPRPVYYRYGFAKCLVSICEDCNIFEFATQKVEPRVITVPTKVNAFESICRVIKRSDDRIDYYEVVKIAYSESEELREYFGPDVTDIKQIDKNLKTLWSFTHRIINESQGMFKVIDRNPDNLVLKWVRGAYSPQEQTNKIKLCGKRKISIKSKNNRINML